MKKNYFLSFAFAALLMAPAAVQAQYVNEAPAGGFDFSSGKDYVVIYAPEAQVSAMGSKIELTTSSIIGQLIGMPSFLRYMILKIPKRTLGAVVRNSI